MLYRRRLEIHLSRTPLASSSPPSRSPCSLGMGHRTRAVSSTLFSLRKMDEISFRRALREREVHSSVSSSLLVDRFIETDSSINICVSGKERGVVRKNKENKRKIKNSYCARLLSESVLFIINRAGHFSSFFFLPSNTLSRKNLTFPRHP